MLLLEGALWILKKIEGKSISRGDESIVVILLKSSWWCVTKESFKFLLCVMDHLHCYCTFLEFLWDFLTSFIANFFCCFLCWSERCRFLRFVMCGIVKWAEFEGFMVNFQDLGYGEKFVTFWKDGASFYVWFIYNED